MIFKKGTDNKNEFLKEESGYLIKTENEDPYIFEGIASSYGNVDSYGDVFLEGSLDDCIGKTIPIMPNHSWDITRAIGYGVLEKVGKNILIKGSFIKDDEVAEKIVKLKNSGVPIKLSIGGTVKESKPYRKEGITYRGISKAEVFETSVVFRGANPKAQITKSEEEGMEELLKELKLLKDKMAKAEEGKQEELLRSIQKLEEKIEKMNSLSDEDKTRLEKAEKLEEEVKKMAETIDTLMKAGTNVPNSDEDIKKYDNEMNTYLKTGEMSETIKKAALNTSAASGGALLSDNRAKEIIKEIIETSPVYGAARVYTSSNDSLKVRVKVKGANNAHAQAEGAASGAASGSTYDFLELKAGKITDKQEVTQEMRDDAEFNVMAEILEDSSENIATKIADLVWNGVGGTGNNEFYGIYKNTEVTAGALEAELTWENAIQLSYKLPKKTRAKSTYYVSTEALVQMRTWKDTTGRPLYTEPLTAGEPGRFNGYSVIEDPYMDDVIAGKYPMFFGSMRDFYTLLRRKGIYIEPKRDSDADMWVTYTRLREGGKVRQPSQGILLKVKAIVKTK